jgi:hypothetical protein
MEDIGLILPCYLASFGAVAVLAWRVVRRGRELSAQVPDEDKPWT